MEKPMRSFQIRIKRSTQLHLKALLQVLHSTRVARARCYFIGYYVAENLQHDKAVADNNIALSYGFSYGPCRYCYSARR